MRGYRRGACQRQVPKRPHKPTSQALGARTIWRHHWRKPSSQDRRPYREFDANGTTVTAGLEGARCWAP